MILNCIIYTKRKNEKRREKNSYHLDTTSLLALRLLFFVMHFLRNFSIADLLNTRCWSVLSIAVLVVSSLLARFASSVLDSCAMLESCAATAVSDKNLMRFKRWLLLTLVAPLHLVLPTFLDFQFFILLPSHG